MKIKQVRKIILQTLSLEKQLVEKKPTLIFQQEKLKNYKSQQLKKKSLTQLISDEKKRKQQKINPLSPSKSEKQNVNIRLIRQRIQNFLNEEQATKATKSNQDKNFFNDTFKDNISRSFITQNTSSIRFKEKMLKKQPHSLQMLKRKLNMNQNRLKQQISHSIMRRSLKIGNTKYPRKGGYPYQMFFNSGITPANKDEVYLKQAKYQSNQNSDSQSIQKSFLIKRRKKQNKYLKRKEIMKVTQIKDQSELIMVNKKTVQQNKLKKMKSTGKNISTEKKQQLFEPWAKHNDQYFFQGNLLLN